ncbi:MAG TPA: hypothetical protein ENK13_03680, partial [Thermopetrobacter sp.]|nr:hypothetical protein [Thermopetrobacter sp.]
MTARLGRMLALGLLALLLVLLMAAAGLWWRLSQGPISLSFLRGHAETLVNDAIAPTGLRLQTSDIILELDEETSIPLVRMNEVRLVDDTGRVLVHAPRGQVGLDTPSLLHGRLAVRSFDLIGPRITIRRRENGQVELGFRPAGKGARRGDGAGGGGKSDRPPGKADRKGPGPADDAGGSGGPGDGGGGAAPSFEKLAMSTVLRFIDEQIFAPAGQGGLETLDVIHIRRASVSYYDERNDLLLFAPRADIDFQRVPFGYVLFARGGISSGGHPWRTEIT